jgi:glycosyltransferase involved in cell wall biosynthesis
MSAASVSVVIPAYNEESALGPILDRTLKVDAALRQALPGAALEVIVVDDGSRDGTAAVAGRYPGVRLIQHPVNQGYGRALKTGFEAARGEYVAFLDADGTYPPEELPRLCRALRDGAADIVVGSRLGGSISRMPFRRWVGNNAFAVLLSWLVGQRVTDTASGMRVFRREVLPRLLPLPDGLHLTPAMSARAHPV